MKQDQKGIAHIGLVALVVLVIGVVGFAAYRVGSNKKDSTKQPAVTSLTDNKAEKTEAPKKKTYLFEKTPLKLDIPENWQAAIDSKEGGLYKGHIQADGGWGIDFTADQGGYGGGPGCNLDGSEPTLPACPTWTMQSKDVLPTGDVLAAYSSDSPDPQTGAWNCTVIVSNANAKDHKVGDKFTDDMWTCFAAITANDLPSSSDLGDTPLSLRIHVIFPYGLDKKASTDYLKDKNYQAVVEALKTLRKS